MIESLQMFFLGVVLSHLPCEIFNWKWPKDKNSEGKNFEKNTSQKKAIFREDFEDIQKYSKIL